MTTRRAWATLVAGALLLLAVAALVWIHVDERAGRHRHAWETRLERHFEQNVPSGGGK